MRVLVVLPTFNEAATIEAILERVREALPEASILVVDDGSPDGTAKIAADLGERSGKVEVLSRPSQVGPRQCLPGRLFLGPRRGYDAFVEMDSDFSHDPDSLPTSSPLFGGLRGLHWVALCGWWLDPQLEPAPPAVVTGREHLRRPRFWPQCQGLHGGFRAYAASVLERIDLSTVRAESYGFQIEMTYRAIKLGRGSKRFRSVSWTASSGHRRCPPTPSSRPWDLSPGGEQDAFSS